MDFTFHMPVQVFSGPGCVGERADLLRGLGRRCLVMFGGRGARESGALDDVLDALRRAGVDATLFPGVGQNPLVSQCQQAAGAAVMDAAKAAAWLAANRVEDTARLFAGTLRRPPLPLVLVGTTAGTGSEVSPTAVLTLDMDMPGLGGAGCKKSVTHPRCYARYAFADPRYTAAMPRGTTVSTALDALSHAVEGYCNPAWVRPTPTPSAISSPRISAFPTAWPAPCSFPPSPGGPKPSRRSGRTGCLRSAAAGRRITVCWKP